MYRGCKNTMYEYNSVYSIKISEQMVAVKNLIIKLRNKSGYRYDYVGCSTSGG